jgi:hypothetical protein
MHLNVHLHFLYYVYLTIYTYRQDDHLLLYIVGEEKVPALFSRNLHAVNEHFIIIFLFANSKIFDF